MDEIATRKKVLLVSPDFGYGGAERSIANLSVLLAPHTELHFVVFNLDISPAYPFMGTLHSLDVHAGTNVFTKLWSFTRRVARLKRLKRKLQVDVSISFLEGSDYVNVLSRGNEKVVLSLRGSKAHDPHIRGVLGYFRHHWLIPWVYNRADHVVVVAKGIAQELKSQYGLGAEIPVSVIPNFFDMSQLESKARETLSSEWGRFFESNDVLISVGRLSSEKGFDSLVKVFGLLKKENPRLKLLIVGSGPAHEQIVQTARLQNLTVGFEAPRELSADVVMPGFQENPVKFIARSTLYILSSLTEGFPNALLEAMSAQVPVAAADCPYGPSEILSESGTPCGLLLPPLSEPEKVMHQWKESLQMLLADKERLNRYRELGSERVREFNTARALDLWKRVIE